MASLRRRADAAFVGLFLLFLGFVVTQLVVGDQLQTRHTARAARLEAARDANVAVLQHMTDAETGVRGFQLTGRADFLDPYERGRAGAYTALDAVAAGTTDPEVLRLLTAERNAASRWIYAYGTPVVNGGGADPDFPLTQRGKELFDDLRDANAAAARAIENQQATAAAADRRESRLAQLTFAGLGAAFLAVTLAVGSWGRRELLVPLEHLRLTLQRLARGDLAARASPAGPREMRTVMEALNHLAAETQRLHAADEARVKRTDLRQAVAMALREHRRPAETAHRVAAMIGEALGADAVHGRIQLDAATRLDVSWPDHAPTMSGRTVRDILAGQPGVTRAVPHVAGAVGVPLHEDGDGLLYVVRRDQPRWSDEEKRLLATLAREIDHAVRQQRLHDRQARLIGELRDLDVRKDAFVSTVTHELRTPLTSILGYTEMLSDGDGGDLTPLQQRGVTAILRNAHRLQATVADLLLLDKAGGALGEEEAAAPVDLAVVAGVLHGEFATTARGRDVDFSGSFSPAWVTGDPRLLERAVRNLLDNALKFTGPGGAVHYRVHADAGSAVLSVRDTGIGIPAGDVPGLFSPFHKAANAMDRAVQGPGLGLAVVRTIVTEHGGTVTVQSRVGEGSEFTITLPLTEPPAEAEAPHVAAPGLAGGRR